MYTQHFKKETSADRYILRNYIYCIYIKKDYDEQNRDA